MDRGARARSASTPPRSGAATSSAPAEMPYRPGLIYKDGVADHLRPGDFPAAFERAARALRLRGVAAPPAGAAAGTARPIGVGLALLRRRAPAWARSRAPTCASTRAARSTSTSASPRRARATRPRWPRSPRPSWACGWEDVQSWSRGDTALFPFGMGTGAAAWPPTPGPPSRGPRARCASKAARVAAEMLECAPEDVRIERAGRTWPACPHASREPRRGRPRRRESRRRCGDAASPGSTPAPTSIPRPSPGRSARRPPRSRSTWRRARCDPSAAYAVVHDPGARSIR